MYCNNCGAEIPERAVVCVKCGVIASNHGAKIAKSGYAIASLVFGIVTFMGGFYLVLPPIMAVIFGHVAIRQLNQNPLLGGRSMARIGLILGYTFVLIYLFLLAAIIIPAIQKNNHQ